MHVWFPVICIGVVICVHIYFSFDVWPFFFGMLVCMQKFHLHHRIYGEYLRSLVWEYFNLDLKPLQYKLGPAPKVYGEE